MIKILYSKHPLQYSIPLSELISCLVSTVCIRLYKRISQCFTLCVSLLYVLVIKQSEQTGKELSGQVWGKLDFLLILVIVHRPNISHSYFEAISNQMSKLTYH